MDKRFLQSISDMDDEVQRLLGKLNSQYQRDLKDHTRGDDINDTEALLKKIAAATVVFTAAYAVLLQKYSSKAVGISLQSGSRVFTPLIKEFPSVGAEKIKIQRLIASKEKNVAKILLNRKFPGTNKNVSQRIAGMSNGTSRTVRNIIFDAQNQGKGAFEIAKLIEGYVKPSATGIRVAPWTIARRVLGKPISYIPTGIPAGSVEYNAMRLARTETAYSYQQASQAWVDDPDFWYTTGVYWGLSKSHPNKDICDEYHNHDEGLGKGVWRKCPKIPHPHCLCPVTPAVMDRDTFMKELKKRYGN